MRFAASPLVSRWYSLHGAFVPVPDPVEDLSTLSPEQLTERRDALRAAFDERRAAADSAPSAAALSELASIQAAHQATLAALAALPPDPAAAGDGEGEEVTPEQLAEQLAALDAQMGVPPPAPDAAPDAAPEPAPPAVDVEAVAAAAARAATAAATEAFSGAVERIVERLTPPAPSGITRVQPRATAPVPPAPGEGAGRRSVLDSVITAAGGTGPDRELTVREVSDLMIERARRLGAGPPDEHLVASIRGQFPEEHRLGQDPEENGAKLAAHAQRVYESLETGNLSASGGLPAPLMPYYDLQVIAESMRPVVGAWSTMAAPRGGITYLPPPHLGDLTVATPSPNPYSLGSAVGIETAAADASGGTKLTFDVPTIEPATASVYIIWRSLQFGNLSARVWPEGTEAFTRLAMAVWARAADSQLLGTAAATATQATAPKTFGSSRQLLGQIGKELEYFRNHNRMDPDATNLRVILPAWVRGVIREDILNTWSNDLATWAVTNAQIEAMFTNLGCSVTWHMDDVGGSADYDQLFAAQDATFTVASVTTASSSATVTVSSGGFPGVTDGLPVSGTGIPSGTVVEDYVVGSDSLTLSKEATASGTVTLTFGGASLVPWPGGVDGSGNPVTQVASLIHAEGSMIHLDSGEIDLGIIRDSTLTAINKFRNFAESFETVVNVGPEALLTVHTISPDGSFAQGITVTAGL